MGVLYEALEQGKVPGVMRPDAAHVLHQPKVVVVRVVTGHFAVPQHLGTLLAHKVCPLVIDENYLLESEGPRQRRPASLAPVGHPLLHVLRDVRQHVGLVVRDPVDRWVEELPAPALLEEAVGAVWLPRHAPDHGEALRQARDRQQIHSSRDAACVVVSGEEGQCPLRAIFHEREVLEKRAKPVDPAAFDPRRLEVYLRCELVLLWGVGAIL
mmetsp:Transcript_67856/g.201965  ORF Transcript_67856/g.201965 Transcript_67856/m.201965 type:complete len:212 (-) Transcript_67856:384-1019(-)